MKIDLYTKAVLTVIAVCLLCLVIRDKPMVPTARAEVPSPRPIMDVNLIGINNHAIKSVPVPDGTGYVLPVHVTNQTGNSE